MIKDIQEIMVENFRILDIILCIICFEFFKMF